MVVMIGQQQLSWLPGQPQARVMLFCFLFLSQNHNGLKGPRAVDRASSHVGPSGACAVGENVVA